MKPVIKDLGKVCITPEGDWDIKKEYANLSIVFNRNDAKVYISKQCVPIDTDILNTDYWHLLVDFDSIVNDMTALEIKSHVDNAIKEYIGDVSDEYNSLEKISNWIVSYVKTTDDKFSELRNYINNEIRSNSVAINAEVNRAQQAETNLEDAISNVDEILHRHIEVIHKDLADKKNAINHVKDTAARVDGNAFSSTANEVKLTTTGVDTANSYTVVLPAATTEKAGVMSAEDKQRLVDVWEEGVKSSSFEAEVLDDGIGINYETFSGSGLNITIPVATTEKAGVMSAVDKVALENVNSIINIGEYPNIQAVWDACKQIALNNPEISIIKYSVKAGVTYNSGVVFQSYHYNDAVVTQYYLYGGGQKHECNVRHIVSDGTTDNWQPIQIFTSYKFENGTLYGYKYGESESEQNKVAIVSIPIGSAVAELMQEVTYSELVALRDKSSLVAGMKYRITDYVTTTVQYNTVSSNHPFDVIVEAVSENELSELAQAIQHEGDTYFDGNDLGAWQLWYSLDNDTDKYEWADAENGKGVIYRMIDERGNDCPYDFKNILFYNNKYTSNTTPDNYYYTFSYVLSGVLYDGTVDSRTRTNCHSNVIRRYINLNSYNRQSLNNIVFLNVSFVSHCHDNIFGNDCHNNRFGHFCLFNTLGNDCCNNIFGDSYKNNILGNDCHDNRFGRNCSNNRLDDYCLFNIFGNDCSHNILSGSCSDNILSNYSKHKVVNYDKTSITLNEEFYDDGSGSLVPIKHPDLSTQPNILPYKFMGQYVYEQLIPVNNDGIVPTRVLTVDVPVILECFYVGIGYVAPCEVNVIMLGEENYIKIEVRSSDAPSGNGLYYKIVYTSMPEEGDYYGYNNY